MIFRLGPFAAGRAVFTVSTRSQWFAGRVAVLLQDLALVTGAGSHAGAAAEPVVNLVVDRAPGAPSHPWMLHRDGEPCETSVISSPARAVSVATPKCVGNTAVCFRWVRTSSGSAPESNSCVTFTMHSMKLFSTSCPCSTTSSQPGCYDVPGQLEFHHSDGTLHSSSILNADNGFTVSNVHPGVWTAQQ